MSGLIPSTPAPGGEILFFQTEDGRTRLEVRLQAETVWLSLNQLAELFQRDKSVVSKHVKNAFDEGELRPEATVAKFATVQTEGGRTVSPTALVQGLWNYGDILRDDGLSFRLRRGFGGQDGD